jgi:hypothetical protein
MSNTYAFPGQHIPEEVIADTTAGLHVTAEA